MEVESNFLASKGLVVKNQQIHIPVLKQKKVQLYIKREDLIHPFVSGNKFRKLKYNLTEATQQNKTKLITFGGAFSNHILATAIAGKLNNFETVGVIRGDELGINFQNTLKTNATLRLAYENGMKFKFISREEYRNKSSKEFLNKLNAEFGNFYLLPEGGTNRLAIKGCEEILTNKDSKFNYICCAVGTGGTLSGIINSAKSYQKIIGFPALKGKFLEDEIAKYAKMKDNWYLETNYHFGGYAKYNSELIRFINEFFKQTKVLLDPVYTAKMIFGILDLVHKNFFPENTKILAIHTGGIQGIEGFNQKLKMKQQQIIKYEI